MSVRVGVHVSIAGSINQAVDRAQERRCDTFQIFTRNPRGWRYKPLEPGEVKQFRAKLEASGIAPAVAHMPYLPNIAAPLGELYENSVAALTSEVARCGQLGIPYLVTHLGSHLGRGLAAGAQQIVKAVNHALKTHRNDVTVLLENTAGTRNSNGSRFEDLQHLLAHVQPRDHVAVCFDTCHAFAAGYDLRSPATVDQTLKLFDEILDLDQIKVIHINDSKGELASARDRHEHIGKGRIGSRGFRALLHHPRLRSLPWILETPIERAGDDIANMRKVRVLAG